MKVVLGWFVVAVVSLVSLGLGIVAASLVDDERIYVGGACMGIIAGIAGGLWIKDKIVGVPNPGPPKFP